MSVVIVRISEKLLDEINQVTPIALMTASYFTEGRQLTLESPPQAAVSRLNRTGIDPMRRKA